MHLNKHACTIQCLLYWQYKVLVSIDLRGYIEVIHKQNKVLANGLLAVKWNNVAMTTAKKAIWRLPSYKQNY